MRTMKDRIRHTIVFEVLAVTIVTVAGSWVTGHEMEKLASLSILFSFLAMGWNFVYNILFDHWDKKYRGAAPRGFWIRTLHAVLFEIVFLFFGIFLVAYWLQISLMDALILDIGFAVFFVIYAFCYNWAYDLVFPIPKEA